MTEISRVNIPLGGNTEVYTDREDRRYFNYANVRKAAHRSNQENFIINSFQQHFSFQVLSNLGNIPILFLRRLVLHNVDQGRVSRACQDSSGFGRQRYEFRYFSRRSECKL